ncbi:hypothetical protein [Cobetia sp. 29-18-1]|uniref:hypothetical protein n=1 Tax=Cobetia sp. 29-18-1 TaxID=3040018 RepID=UPI00244CA756|nr:hypothetical protein [Cobetia sp. 29-18-1]MDH2299870.1 hypothetical protein [Cobetia sp. 29-18-1]
MKVKAWIAGGVMLMLAGCAGNANIKDSTGNMTNWTVEQPIKEVFRVYKDHLEENYSGGDVLWAEGTRVKGFFYTDEAELTVSISGNPFIKGPFLYVEMQEASGKTAVTARASNNHWEDVAHDLRDL